MAGRIVREVLLVLGVTLALAYLVTVLVYAGSAGDDLAHVLLQVAPRFMAGFFGVAFVVFAVLVTVSALALRRRARRVRVWTQLAAAVVAALVNTLVITGLASATGGSGGMDGLVLTLALTGSVFFLVTGVVAVLVVQLLIMKRAPEPLEVA